MSDPINWPAPEPRFYYGLYSYTCECPACGGSEWSDKGMLNPERAYRRHWWFTHMLGHDRYDGGGMTRLAGLALLLALSGCSATMPLWEQLANPSYAIECAEGQIQRTCAP
jgi:cytochrome c